MAINAKLLAEIISRSGLSRAQVYARIKRVAGENFLPNSLAAIKLGSELGLAINKFASSEELHQLRSNGEPVTPPPVAVASSKSMAKKNRTALNGAKPKLPPNQVFVVHGRDAATRKSLFDFIRSVGIHPLEWNQVLALTKKPSPYVGEILEAAFNKARAIVVLFTPDDVASLREELWAKQEPSYEKRPTPQARPNVLFEAGMAFSRHPDRTVLVEVGNLRPFSDIGGRHVVKMSNATEKRQELATKLRNAGCEVDLEGSDWMSAGDFSDPELRK